MLLTLCIVLVTFNIPYFSSTYFPRGDSLSFFSFFHYYYNHFFVEGELPLWVIYGGQYGYKSLLFQIGASTPLLWLAGSLGIIFRVEDVLWVFKLGMLFEQILFLFGMYVLCTLLFKEKLTIFLVCLFNISSFFWFKHIFFDFHLVYVLPLIIALVIIFLREGKPGWFWLAGVVFITFNHVVAASIQAYTLIMLLGPMAWHYRRSLLSIRQVTPISIAAIILITVFAMLLIYSVHHSYDTIERLSPSRNENFGVTLLNFLTYGPFPNAGVFQEFLSGWMPVDRQTSYYIGILPIISIVFALVFVRRREFFTFFCGLVFVILFSIGGSFSMIAYFLPGMEVYHHVGLVLAIAKMLALICSGYGIDFILNHLRKSKGHNDRLTSWHLVIALSVLWLIFDLSMGRDFIRWIFTGAENLPASDVPPADQLALFITIVRLSTYFCMFAGLFIVLRIFSSRKWANLLTICMLLATAMMDVVTFQIATYVNRHRLPVELAEKVDALHAGWFPIVLERKTMPVYDRQKDAMDIMLFNSKTKPRAVDSYLAVGARFDPCIPVARTNEFPIGVKRLLEARGGQPNLWPDISFVPKSDNSLLKVLGCSGSKIRLVPRSATFVSDEEIYHSMRIERDLDKFIFLKGSRVGSEAGSLPIVQDDDENIGNIEVLKYSANEIVVKASTMINQPVWLVVADSYHPGWEATVNDRPETIQEAYLAFKAVRIPPGESVVRFRFNEGIMTVIYYIFAPFVWLVSGSVMFVFIIGYTLGFRRFQFITSI